MPGLHRPRSVPSAGKLALLSSVLYLPFIGFGYGTDIDITNIRRSGESILAGDYRYSRPPGAFPHEFLTGILDRLGGAVAVNLGSVVMAVTTLAALGWLVERRHGARAGRIAVVVVATQPWFWVAATSLGDYLYALAFLLLGMNASRGRRPVIAGLFFATAIGFRSGTAFLVAAYLSAELIGRWTDDRRDDVLPRRQLLVMAGVGLLVGLAWFIPPWLSSGRTTRFLMNQLEAGDLAVMVGRWGIKNIAFFGILGLVVLAAGHRTLLDAIRRFPDSLLVRFSVLAAVVTEILYLRFPWKPVHLLPMIVCVAILLAVNPRTSNRLVGALIVSQLVLAMVSITIAAPDVVDRATGGELDLGVTRGVVHNELDCRLRQPYPGDWPDLDTLEADVAAVDVFACQARSWRAGADPSPPAP